MLAGRNAIRATRNTVISKGILYKGLFGVFFMTSKAYKIIAGDIKQDIDKNTLDDAVSSIAFFAQILEIPTF